MTFRSIVAVSLLCVSITANANVVYDEAVDGDAGSIGNEVSLGVLSLGISKIVTDGSWTGTTGLDLDIFEFEIAAGHVLSAVQFHIAGPIFVGDIFSQSISLGINLIPPSTNQQIVEYFNPIRSDGFDTIEPALPLGPGGYQMVANNSGGTHQTDFSSTWHSVATLVVTEVPEPYTFGLFGAGILGFIFSRRRRAGRLSCLTLQ